MSQVQVGEVDLCDNLPKSEDLTAQTRNLNETNTLTQRQNEEEGGLIQKASVNNNGKDVEEEQGKAACTERGREDEEEDIDEVMKDEEDEEESEESSCLMRCQSPDTPMTDSSYSETGKEHTHMNEKIISYTTIDKHFPTQYRHLCFSVVHLLAI